LAFITTAWNFIDTEKKVRNCRSSSSSNNNNKIRRVQYPGKGPGQKEQEVQWPEMQAVEEGPHRPHNLLPLKSTRMKSSENSTNGFMMNSERLVLFESLIGST